MNNRKFIRFSNETIKKLLNPENPDSVKVKDEGYRIRFIGEELTMEYRKSDSVDTTSSDQLMIVSGHIYIIAIDIMGSFMDISFSPYTRHRWYNKNYPEHSLLKRIINLFEEQVKDSDIEIVEI